MKMITGKERDALILRILDRIDNDAQVVGAPERTAAWEKGWAEALHKFKQNPCVESLMPAFVHMDQPVRWHGEFYHQDDHLNEMSFIKAAQARVGDYLGTCKRIAEFGCGTGLNLVALAQRFPHKQLTGYDFSLSSVRLISEIWNALNIEVLSEQFDMLTPNYAIRNFDGAFTFGAIEQLAGKFHAFIDYLIAVKPQIVVHVEPTVELYDPTSLVDSLAIRFHKKRGYTYGLLPWLQQNPRVKVLDVERGNCGSLMIEGYNVIVWRPA